MSCRQKLAYMDTVNHQLDLWSPENMTPFEQNGVRVSIIRAGFAANGAVCRTYQTEYQLTPPGVLPPVWDAETNTACYDGIRHLWVHNYRDRVFDLSREHRFFEPVPWVHINVQLVELRHQAAWVDFLARRSQYSVLQARLEADPAEMKRRDDALAFQKERHRGGFEGPSKIGQENRLGDHALGSSDRGRAGRVSY